MILWLSVLGPSSLPVVIAEPLQTQAETNVWASGTQQPAGISVRNATAEDLGRLGEAAMAFAGADLELPTLDIWFHTDRRPCDEHHGTFRATSESRQIRICSPDIAFVYEHELAHAWVAANVDDTQRSAFMNSRGLEHWADRDVPWNQRGTEWAAVVIQQGLSGLPLPPTLSNEAKSRLESFELLTGRVAPVLVEWITQRDLPCSDRPTGLSQPIADVTGRSCALSRSVSMNHMGLIGQTDSRRDPTRRYDYGLGVELFDAPGVVYGARGNLPGYITLAMHSPETLETFIYVSTNDQHHDLSWILDDAARQISDQAN